jgi:hypothetical protein
VTSTDGHVILPVGPPIERGFAAAAFAFFLIAPLIALARDCVNAPASEGTLQGGQRRGQSACVVFGRDGAVPTFGGDGISGADVGTALRAFAHPTRARALMAKALEIDPQLLQT